MNHNRTPFKRAAAILALILIGCILLMLIYGALIHHTGLMMTSLFCLIVVPVLIYLFMRFTAFLKDYRRDSDPR